MTAGGLGVKDDADRVERGSRLGEVELGCRDDTAWLELVGRTA